MKTDKKGKAGRPPKYATETELKNKIEQYFVDCKEKGQTANKAGLCMFLNISRETYCEYRNTYPDAIKSADLAIENVWVQRLAGNAPTGAIFYLKNAFKEEYRDRTETDVTSKGEKIMGIEYIVPKNEKS